jgi:hypothetical protein
VKLTPSSTRAMPSSVRNSTARSSTVNRGLMRPTPWGRARRAARRRRS